MDKAHFEEKIDGPVDTGGANGTTKQSGELFDQGIGAEGAMALPDQLQNRTTDGREPYTRFGAVLLSMTESSIHAAAVVMLMVSSAGIAKHEELFSTQFRYNVPLFVVNQCFLSTGKRHGGG